jgi:hypothetical protein
VSAYPPEFVRRLLGDIDQATAVVDEMLVNGAPETLEAYRHQVGRRRGLQEARGLIVARLDNETRQMLGIPPASSPRPRAAIGKA